MTLNEKAITKNVLSHDRIFVQKAGDHYWICDGFAMFKVDVRSPVLSDRNAFPELPSKEGQSLTYHAKTSASGRVRSLKHGCKETSEGPDIASIIPHYDRGTDELTITPLVYQRKEGDMRVAHTGGHVTYLNEDYVWMVKQVHGVKWYQAKHEGPVAVEHDGELIASIMPMLSLDTDGYLYATLASLRPINNKGRKAA